MIVVSLLLGVSFVMYCKGSVNLYSKIFKPRGVLILVLISGINLHALKIDRVILSGDKPFYLDFWPYAARAWKQLIGVKPTLAVIGTIPVDESLGDVIRFQPLKGISTGVHAQVIRLLLPILFPDEVCIISDIDQLPINRAYFQDAITHIPDDKFVIYNDKSYPDEPGRIPMCYCVAKGRTFKDLFGVETREDIERTVRLWGSLGFGFHTDELVLSRSIASWSLYATRCFKLGDTLGPSDKRRINRHFWGYDPQLLKENYYVDAHLLRPYFQHQEELDRLARLAGVRW
jgi:hypothetical protein